MSSTYRTILYAAVCYAILAAVPHVGGIPIVVGIAVGTLLFAVASLALIHAAAQVPMEAWEEGLTLALTAAAWWFLLSPIASRGPWEQAVVGPAAAVFFMLACVALGRFLARIVRDRNLLLPVCLVAAVADIYTVFWGPTGEALEKAPEIVERLSVSIPQMGSAAGAEGVRGLAYVAAMGLGDVIFAALFFAAGFRFGMNMRRTFWAVLIAAATGMMIVLFYGPIGAMPLLPFIVAGFLVANYRAFRLTPTEKRDLLIAAVLIIALATAALLLMRPAA